MLKILLALLVLSPTAFSFSIKGVNFVSVPYSKSSYSSFKAKESLSHLNQTGANWISLPIAIFQDSINDSEMRLISAMVATKDRLNISPTEKELGDAVAMAKNLDMKVMLMPTLELNMPGFLSSALIGETMAPYEVRRWFKHYEEIVLKIAKWGEQNGADIICLGHNLLHLASYEKYWVEMIEKVREIYKGKLTYSASSNIEFLKSGFWKHLDYVGMIADFDFVLKKDTTPEHLEEVAENFLEKAHYMSKVWKKKVIVTRAAMSPAHSLNEKGVAYEVHHKSQANFYRGIFNSLKKSKKILGIFWGDWVADPHFGGEKDVSLSPQLKEAELVIREEYGGEAALPQVEVKEVKDKEERNRMYCKWCPEDVDL
jgi:hypothetical protein